MFKVGDKVKIVREDSAVNSLKLNHEGLIEKVDLYDVCLTYKVSGQWCRRNQLELVPEYTWKSKFNIGDVVEYGNYCYFIVDVIFSDNRVEYTIVSSISESFTGETTYCDKQVVREEQLKLYKKPKVEEMTLKQICKELGKDIKIIK